VTQGELETFVKDTLADSTSGNLALMKQEIRAEVREDIRGELQDFKQEIVTAAQTYTDNLTKKLKLELDSQFETMMGTLNNTRKLLNGDTPTRGPGVLFPHQETHQTNLVKRKLNTKKIALPQNKRKRKRKKKKRKKKKALAIKVFSIPKTPNQKHKNQYS
jgi:hypothetical protein